MAEQFSYKNDELYAEDVSISTVSNVVGTPFYLYSATAITENFLNLRKSLGGLENLICYSVKANSNIAILKLLSQLGAGMDVVSVGEYLRAKIAGVPGEKIVFSGVGKRRDEISQVLVGGIKQFNVESEAELKVLNELSISLNKRTSITIRVNPDIDAKTHEKISTGKKDNKFGIPINRAREVYLKASQMLGVKVVGVDVHIGSQLTDLEPFRMAFTKLAELVDDLLKDGHEIKCLDLGGGLGISYQKTNDVQPSLQEYGQIIRETVGSLRCEILVEPGRFIVGNAGILVSEIIYKKFGEDREFLIVDSAMNDLIRPSLYAAYHEILPIKKPNNSSSFACYDVVGPVCETGDTFATQRSLMEMESGELLAFMSAGAYGSVMASEYNTRPLIPEVLVKGDNFSIIRARPLIEDIIRRDIVPDWV